MHPYRYLFFCNLGFYTAARYYLPGRCLGVLMKDKTTAGVLAIMLGGIGVHKFYLGRMGAGIAYLFFSWTGIPFLLGLFEGISYLSMSPERFNIEYNPELHLSSLYFARGLLPPSHPQQPMQSPQAQAPQNIVVSVSNPNQGSTVSIADELKKLNELRLNGILTDEEFDAQKNKLLGHS
jgi:TM2 domain-containing membrane protein YozV